MNEGIWLGVVTGLIPILLRAVEMIVKGLGDKAAHQREVELRKLDSELSIAEAEAAIRWANVPGAGPKTGNVLKTGSRAPYMDVDLPLWVNIIRGMMRPVATFVLLVGSLVLTAYAVSERTAALTAAAPELVSLVVYLTTSSVLWWFSGRLVGRK